MKIKYQDQDFQRDAAQAVVDVFAGQPKLDFKENIGEEKDSTGQKDMYGRSVFGNAPIDERLKKPIPLPSKEDSKFNQLLLNLNKVQLKYDIKPSDKLELTQVRVRDEKESDDKHDVYCEDDRCYNLSVEMETGVGKTFTYIKTMYELKKHYGWSKFIIVVPSIAIREGVYATFKSTQEYFHDKYGDSLGSDGARIDFFIYNSSDLQQIQKFTEDGIKVMIINSQAFNAKGEAARRIYLEQDKFGSRRPIDVIAMTNPILIIDEPQSVEGEKTKESLKDFNPLITLRYSATHRDEYNMVYRLDAIDAYRMKLVKKIAVKSITVKGTTGTTSYIYAQKIRIGKEKKPEAVVEIKTENGEKIKTLKYGSNLYELSGKLPEYENNFEVKEISAGKDKYVEFRNGIKINEGEAIGKIGEEQVRRIQIRETIESHIEREKKLFSKRIKVLSLFFIDEVKKYRDYDDEEEKGEYAKAFEEEYKDIIQETLDDKDLDEEYRKYLTEISAEKTHAGYFSIDKKSNRFIDPDTKSEKKESSDTDAYDLIMRNKEQLLSMDEPVRFIFSHSALKEGWDNPNVFQICTLKQSDATTRKRQEIGRGMRLCVDQSGKRMDKENQTEDVHSINILTVIANESYDSFAKALQDETVEDSTDRPRKVDESLFEGMVIFDNEGKNELEITRLTASRLYFYLVDNGYVYYNEKDDEDDDNGKLTTKYINRSDKQNIDLPQNLKGYEKAIIRLLGKIYEPIKPHNVHERVEVKMNEGGLKRKEFQELWEKIKTKSAFFVNFDSKNLVDTAIEKINGNLDISDIKITKEEGGMEVSNDDTMARSEVKRGEAMTPKKTKELEKAELPKSNVKYDLIANIIGRTGLTRKTVINILYGIEDTKFAMFAKNPERFISEVSNIINTEKTELFASTEKVEQHITYEKLNEVFSEHDVFPLTYEATDQSVSEKISEKGLYEHLVYDSGIEEEFGEELEGEDIVSFYVKLPKKFYIDTPAGQYNPDWAVVFKEESDIKHIYFIAETKGNANEADLRGIENMKIACAKKHFDVISSGKVKYDVVTCFRGKGEKGEKRLLDLVKAD